MIRSRLACILTACPKSTLNPFPVLLKPLFFVLKEAELTGGDFLGRPSKQRLQKGQPMPLLNISLRAGKSESYRQAIFDALYVAMRDTFNVPEDDQFMTITEHEAANFRYGASYLDIPRSDDLVFIQISAMNSRTGDQKKALFKRIADLLSENPGLRREDVFVNIIEGSKDNWSLGNGIAQYA